MPKRKHSTSPIRKRWHRSLGCLLLLNLLDIRAVYAAQSAVFSPNATMTFGDLVKAVSHAPEIVAAERELHVREAARLQSQLWANPVVDATWATVPIGRTNPTGLERPLAKVPSYHVGVSYTFPLGKRGPIQAARVADVHAARSRRCATGRQLALDLAVALGNMAAIELRIASLQQLVEAAAEQEQQVQARLNMQMASGLEVDRAAIERGRFEQQLSSAESELSAQRAACSASTGVSCARFDSAEEARLYLEKWVGIDVEKLLARAPQIDRPEVKALTYAEQAARHEQTFFKRQRIPDPTVRLGYVHDQFWTSGAQPNSLELTLILPMPLFDWGQAGARSAQAAAEGYASERSAMRQTTAAVIPELCERLQAQRVRRRNLIETLIPRAKAVVDDVVRAYDTRLLSMNDVIQARRALLDLLLAEVDGLADAYTAVLGLRSQIAESDSEGCVQ